MTSPPPLGGLLFLLFYLYAVICVSVFGPNDPWHFGDLLKAMVQCLLTPPPLTHFDTYLHTTYLLDISISPDFAFMQMLVLVMATMLVLAMAVSPLLLLCTPGDVVPHVHS